MPKHHTDGKIIYLNPITANRLEKAQRLFDLTRYEATDVEAPDTFGALQTQRTTLEQLEAAEHLPELGKPMPAAPSIRQYTPPRPLYFDGESIDPVTEHFYGGMAAGSMQAATADFPVFDEADIWTDENRAQPQPQRIKWRAVALVSTIILIVIMLWAGIIGLLSYAGLPAFISSLFPTT